MSAVEKFPILLSEAEEESSAVPPCFSHEGVNVRSTARSASPRVSISPARVIVPLICVRSYMEPTRTNHPNHSTSIFVTATCTFSL
jgi:hypothetical protein